jgi:hypothetical protein
MEGFINGIKKDLISYKTALFNQFDDLANVVRVKPSPSESKKMFVIEDIKPLFETAKELEDQFIREMQDRLKVAPKLKRVSATSTQATQESIQATGAYYTHYCDELRDCRNRWRQALMASSEREMKDSAPSKKPTAPSKSTAASKSAPKSKPAPARKPAPKARAPPKKRARKSGGARKKARHFFDEEVEVDDDDEEEEDEEEEEEEDKTSWRVGYVGEEVPNDASVLGSESEEEELE